MDPPSGNGNPADTTNSDGAEDADEDERKPPAEVDGSKPAAPRKRKIDGKPEKTNHHERWKMMFDRLVAYKQKYGDTNVPNRYPENPQVCSVAAS
jgi:hypothetical protein